MADVLGAASLVALLSDYEAHPIAVVEALAVGRPVLVTDSSGLHELIVAGLARGVDRHATAGDIAAAVISQLNEPPAVHAASLPTWDDCARQLNELYRSVLA
jgi:glycosyltransferase involved in cell wall biosynthesis